LFLQILFCAKLNLDTYESSSTDCLITKLSQSEGLDLNELEVFMGQDYFGSGDTDFSALIGNAFAEYWANQTDFLGS
jgi:hypothetical protein